VGHLYESVDRIGASYLQSGTDRSDMRLLLLLLRGRGGDGESPNADACRLAGRRTTLVEA
jgi:hypothetical protein